MAAQRVPETINLFASTIRTVQSKQLTVKGKGKGPL